MVRTFSLAACLAFCCVCAAQNYGWAPKPPGPRQSPANGYYANAALAYGTRSSQGVLVRNLWDSTSTWLGPEPFRITYRDGSTYTPPRDYFKRERNGSVSLLDGRHGLAATLQTTLLGNSHYVRCVLTLKPTGKDVDIAFVQLLDISADAVVVGKTSGSPALVGNIFFGVEHPMAEWRKSGQRLLGGMRRGLPLRKGTSTRYSAVIGVAPRGQLRRSFLSYVESVRAHPYRTFLHYNSWYDIGYFTPYNEADCIDRIRKFGEELTRKRGVRLDSFLFDDGWDNYESVWEFHTGFPHGFSPLASAAAEYGAAPGVWLSPWGGYGQPRQKRLAYGKAHGMEVDSQGYALSGPNYYKRFHDVTLDFVTKQGINHFKFDGTGSPDKSTSGSRFDSDFDAAISLIGDLRKAKPDLFVNLTTGTWPSPFWLRCADSIWRGGSDHSFAGVGTNRQQWITYRDSDTFHGVVERGPLYPLNSLMLHGIIYAQHAHNLNTDPGNDFRDEVRDYFGCGTQLQELYVTPDLLTAQNWNDLADAAKWSRANADVLKDTHWVGGDPSKLDVYGWASWAPRKGILVLRNPSDKPQAFAVDIARVLELPPGFARAYVGHSPWRGEAETSEFPVGKSVVLDLKPFEVRVLDLEVRK